MTVIIELAATTRADERMHALRDQPAHAGVVYDEEGGSWTVFDSRAVDMAALRNACRRASSQGLDGDQYAEAWEEIDRVIGSAMICDCN